MTDSIRALLYFTQPYWTINREERNYAALLYASLLAGDNLRRLLDHVCYDLPVIPNEVGVYFEYAYLRDLWSATRSTNEQKRDLITRLLGTDDVRALDSATTSEWNEHFGARSSASIEYPGNWSLGKFDRSVAAGNFLTTCMFKWSFRIKPDLVIHTSNDHALVIEAKYDSGEGTYPAIGAEKKIFKERGLASVRQTQLQAHLFEQLLGVQAKYVYVVRDAKARSATHATHVWSDLFAAMDTTHVPPFVARWLDQLATGSGPPTNRES